MTAAATGGDAVVEVRRLVKHFPVAASLVRRTRAEIHAVCGVDFSISSGETLGLVGESGCGKSTTGRMVLGLIPPTSGTVLVHGDDLHAMDTRELRTVRSRMQAVFQDPYASLNPRMTVGRSVAEPLRIQGVYRNGGPERVAELLRLVELDPSDAGRYPHEFSGGQRQRIGIARALSLRPDLVVLDEPVSSLDVSIQAGIVNLLADLQEQLGIAYLLIAHGLSLVRHISHRVAVMYLGKIVEIGTADDIFSRPAHPYTQALLSAAPVPDPDREAGRARIVLSGDVPGAADPPSGCRFRTRCWKADAVCATDEPELIDRGHGHPVACHFAEVTRLA